MGTCPSRRRTHLTQMRYVTRTRYSAEARMVDTLLIRMDLEHMMVVRLGWTTRTSTCHYGAANEGITATFHGASREGRDTCESSPADPWWFLVAAAAPTPVSDHRVCFVSKSVTQPASADRVYNCGLPCCFPGSQNLTIICEAVSPLSAVNVP